MQTEIKKEHATLLIHQCAVPTSISAENCSFR
ncbi:hypothetical protein T09_6904 [Trichinella sp. T9]|nr:hypothetical protein T09_6904 [Trichinella sp. T9]